MPREIAFLVLIAACVAIALVLALIIPTFSHRRPKLREPDRHRGEMTELVEAGFWDHCCAEDSAVWAIAKGHTCNWCGAKEE